MAVGEKEAGYDSMELTEILPTRAPSWAARTAGGAGAAGMAADGAASREAVESLCAPAGGGDWARARTGASFLEEITVTGTVPGASAAAGDVAAMRSILDGLCMKELRGITCECSAVFSSGGESTTYSAP